MKTFEQWLSANFPIGTSGSVRDLMRMGWDGAMCAATQAQLDIKQQLTTEQPEDGAVSIQFLLAELSAQEARNAALIDLSNKVDQMYRDERERAEALAAKVRELEDMLLNLADAVLDGDTSREACEVLARQANALIGDTAAMQEGS